MSKFIDLSGQRFGKLIVVKKVPKPNTTKDKGRGTYWLCKCDCGKEKIIKTASLKYGASKSCGCSKIKDLTGKRFGMLIVISFHHSDKYGAYWSCVCDCGNEIIRRANSLIDKQSKTKNCGCYQYNKLPEEESSFHNLFSKYKNNDRKLEFNISKEVFRKLTKLNCFYCGKEPSQKQHRSKSNGEYIYNGLDRIDSSKGYTIDNVVPCCGRCNEAKNDEKQDDFFAWIKKVYEHSILGKENAS